jgi:hypothetical protein
MRAVMRHVLLTIAVVAVLAGITSQYVPAADACVQIYDPIRWGPVIVGGRFTGWEQAASVDATGGVTWPPEVGSGIRVHMEIDRVFKGEAPEQIDLSDNQWHPTDCNAFHQDPTGGYAIIAVRQSGSQYYASEGDILFWGDDPEGEGYNLTLSRLGVEPLPSSSFPLLPAAIAAIAGPVAFLIGASYWPGRHR